MGNSESPFEISRWTAYGIKGNLAANVKKKGFHVMDEPIADIKIHPSSIRFWLGYRHERYAEKRDRFYQALAEIFIPATMQQMGPLGLTSYLPIILPDSNNLFPDELALVVYPSQAIYRQATRETVIGRSYGALHGTTFNFSRRSAIPRSTSAFPSAFSRDWADEAPYYLLEDSISWRQGQTLVHVCQLKPSEEPQEVRELLTNAILAWSESSPEGVNGSILRIQNGYLIYWEHYAESSEDSDSLLNHINSFLEAPFVHALSHVTSVLQQYSLPDPGVDCEIGELMDIRI